MLVLTRYKGQTICIGDNVRITVQDIIKGGVRLAIEAPRDVSVHRLEVHEAIQRDGPKPASECNGGQHGYIKRGNQPTSEGEGNERRQDDQA